MYWEIGKRKFWNAVIVDKSGTASTKPANSDIVQETPKKKAKTTKKTPTEPPSKL